MNGIYQTESSLFLYKKIRVLLKYELSEFIKYFTKARMKYPAGGRITRVH